jgi:homogentisate 1,2-dioxygenase
MPVYHQLGRVPPKRHTAFRDQNGCLHPEELIGNHGFTGPASLVYHLYEPTRIKSVRRLRRLEWMPEADCLLRHRHFRTTRVKPGPSMVFDRMPLLFNGDVALSLAGPTQNDDLFYRNAQGDEIVYVSDGSGVLESLFGALPFHRGDYLVVPR